MKPIEEILKQFIEKEIKTSHWMTPQKTLAEIIDDPEMFSGEVMASIKEEGYELHRTDLGTDQDSLTVKIEAMAKGMRDAQTNI